ncbi:unnamed protein product [Schistosoma mattheei]|uniref:Uncharacterized protein n=1 Tax=Schistosoma mattheei TaxID=31246 RepID=A0A183PYG4_9TREM|nr:unnamed protein product [Schistosoma mattheei]
MFVGWIPSATVYCGREASFQPKRKEKNVQAVKQAKEERVRELRNAVELMVARLDSQLKSKLVTLMSQRSQLFQEIESLENLLHDVQYAVDVAKPSEMVERSSEILALLSDVHCKPMASFVSAPVPADFVVIQKGLKHHNIMKPLVNSFSSKAFN